MTPQSWRQLLLFVLLGDVMSVSERPCYKDLKTEKKLMKYVYPFKRYNVLKFEFCY